MFATLILWISNLVVFFQAYDEAYDEIITVKLPQYYHLLAHLYTAHFPNE